MMPADGRNPCLTIVSAGHTTKGAGMYVELTPEGLLYVDGRLVCRTNNPKKVLFNLLRGLRTADPTCG